MLRPPANVAKPEQHTTREPLRTSAAERLEHFPLQPTWLVVHEHRGRPKRLDRSRQHRATQRREALRLAIDQHTTLSPKIIAKSGESRHLQQIAPRRQPDRGRYL